MGKTDKHHKTSEWNNPSRCCPGMTGQDQGLSWRPTSCLMAGTLSLNPFIQLSTWTIFFIPSIFGNISTSSLYIDQFSSDKRKKITRWWAREIWRIELHCSQSYFPLHLPFDTFYLIAFRPGLIFPGPRPMLICMAILYMGQIHEDGCPAWIHKQSHIHQVARVQYTHCGRMEDNEKSCHDLKSWLTRVALWSSLWVNHSIILMFYLSNTCGIPFWALDM